MLNGRHAALLAELLVSGITVNTSPTDYRAIEAMQFQRFDGSQWIFFGEPMVEK